MSPVRHKRMNKALNVVFAVIVFGVIGALAALYLILPTRAISGSEELSVFPAVNISSYLAGDFQNDLEQALKDQFALRDSAVEFTETVKAGEKDIYNSAQNVLRGLDSSSGLVPFGRVYRMNATDWLSNMVYTYDAATVAGYEKKTAQINKLAARYPDIKFYVYYCTRAEDVNWFDDICGVNSYSYPALLQSLLADGIRFSKTEFSDLHDYSLKMYKTDHHWNHNGAWVAYKSILNTFCSDFAGLGEPRRILYKKSFGGLTWQGARYRECGVSIGQSHRDEFKVYAYDLPEHQTFYGDTEMSLGLAEDYDSGNIVTDQDFDQYLNYYGFEAKPITLDYGSVSGYNLLIIGDSFTRAIREPLASHFDKTVYLNFRILENDGVDIDQIISDNDIDAVLLMGQQDAWSGYFFKEGIAE